jgi:hypothetical protein
MRRQLKMKIATQCLLVTPYVGALVACTDANAADTSTAQGLEFAQRTVVRTSYCLARSRQTIQTGGEAIAGRGEDGGHHRPPLLTTGIRHGDKGIRHEGRPVLSSCGSGQSGPE